MSLQRLDTTGERKGLARSTGSKVIVWAGQDSGGTQFNDGAVYDSGANTWTPMSTVGAPTLSLAASVWVGTQMVVWGGFDGINIRGTGAMYMPP